MHPILRKFFLLKKKNKKKPLAEGGKLAVKLGNFHHLFGYKMLLCKRSYPLVATLPHRYTEFWKFWKTQKRNSFFFSKYFWGVFWDFNIEWKLTAAVGIYNKIWFLLLFNGRKEKQIMEAFIDKRMKDQQLKMMRYTKELLCMQQYVRMYEKRLKPCEFFF